LPYASLSKVLDSNSPEFAIILGLKNKQSSLDDQLDRLRPSAHSLAEMQSNKLLKALILNDEYQLARQIAKQVLHQRCNGQGLSSLTVAELCDRLALIAEVLAKEVADTRSSRKEVKGINFNQIKKEKKKTTRFSPIYRLEEDVTSSSETTVFEEI
jgi:hypothetical protein